MATVLGAVARGFGLELAGPAPRPFGGGLIHATWLVHTLAGPHLLQRVNGRVFPDPAAVTENAAAAAGRVDDALCRVGDHDPRHRLRYLAGPHGRPWLRDDAGAVWRAAVLVPGARPADPSEPAEVFAAARALGGFPGLLAAGSGPELRQVLPGFHDTPARVAALRAAAAADAAGRLTGCRRELDRLLELRDLAARLAVGGGPTRPVHNDAKLDNVLVDAASGEALCVIDLDTVMPGLAAHDFGDLVRSAVTGRPEDEPELQRIGVGEGRFRTLAGGYLQGAAGWIGDDERSRLLDGALVITFEQAVRFLTDHLAGDLYYPVRDVGHNLRRSRAQLRLLEALLAAEVDLRRIVDEL